uniref:Cytochrome P450 3081C1 n=1 Tax=Paracyclopina nana TaxID=565004 RepID=A0A0F7J015_PARNA|nr:cytochrome P450 3081C1 [Paracyclopina nana]
MILATVAVIFVVALIYYFSRKFSYFKRHGLPYETGYFPLGSTNSWKMMTGSLSFANVVDDIYYKYKDEKCAGYYGPLGDPILVVRDWELSKKVLIKDFDHFVDRRPFAIDEKLDPYFSRMMVMMRGEAWKSMRSIMTPVFTSGRLKNMIPTMNKIAGQLIGQTRKLGDSPVHTKKLFKDFAMEVIMATGFGVEVNSWDDDNHIVKKMVDKLMGYDGNPLFILKFLFLFSFPKLGSFLGIKVSDAKAEKFFVDIIEQTMKQRKGEGASEQKNDLIDILLKAMEDSKNSQEGHSNSSSVLAQMSDEEKELVVVSQGLLMFFAGFDTISTTLALTFHFLATNPDLQEKLLAEVRKVMNDNGGDLTYDCLNKLHYTDAFINEAMRCYNFVGALERVCVKPYYIPEYGFYVPEGMLVQVPGQTMMQDEEFLANPKLFNPDNYFEGKVAPAMMNLNFGLGPRNCIAMRFAMMQVKLVVAHMVSTFAVLQCEKTPKELIPNPLNASLLPKGDLWVSFQPRK